MTAVISRLVSAWQMVARRSLAHWRLLSSVILGVLLASAIMAGTVVYFDALRDLALKNALIKHTKNDLGVLVQVETGPTSSEEHEKVFTIVERAIDDRLSWMLSDRIRSGKSPTFFLTAPGSEDQAGDDNHRTFFAFMPRLAEHVTLLPGGRLPGDRIVNAPGEPLVLEVIIPRDAAQLFSVGVGDRFAAVPYWSDASPYVSVVISGIFDRKDLNDELWYLDRNVLHSATGSSFVSRARFRTLPFYISQKAYLEELGAALPRMASTYGWFLPVDLGRLNSRNAELTLANLETMHSTLAAMLPKYRHTTALDNAIEEYDRKLFFNKLPMFIVLVLIALVILYFVATLSMLVVEERRGEVALLRSRGASSTQILTVFVLEGATIVILAVVAGPLLAAATISALGITPAFSDLTGGVRLDVTLSNGAYMMSALGGVLSFVALIVPAVQASRIGVTRHRQEAARPSRLPAFQRYYVDVLLLLISIYLFRQLTEQGSVVATELFGDLAVSQVLLAMPGLMLVASAMVLLRLFPLVMGLASRLMSSWLPAGVVLAVWQMARNPTHYARLSLLLILTAGLGIFASSFGATLERSFDERVLYATGSDLKISGVRSTVRRRRVYVAPEDVARTRSVLAETYEKVKGVDRASPVLRSSGYDLSKGTGAGYVMLGIEGQSLSDVAWFRDDFADKPMARLVNSLKVQDPPEGIRLPDTAFSIGIRLKSDRAHPTVRLHARIKNAEDRYSTYRLGTLDSGEWTVLETSLRYGVRQFIVTSRPLSLVSLWVEETGGGRLQAGSILIDKIWAQAVGGEEVLEGFEDTDDWSVLKVTPDAVSDALRSSDVSFDDDKGSALFSWGQGNPLTARGIFHGQERLSLPVLASEAFLRATGHAIGEEFEVAVGGFRVPVRVTDTVDLFPTMTLPDQRFLVADLLTLTRYANLGISNRELSPNEVWISTTTEGDEREELLKALENVTYYTSGQIRDRAKLLADSKVDPLVDAGWKALLFIAFAAVLVLSCLGFLVHAYVSFRSRQLQFALLRTVGFSMRQLITTVWIEQALVIAAGMALGTWMGGRLGATIMPFLGHDDWGGRVMPPFVMQVNWGALLITYAAMVFVFAVITLGLIWMIHRISVHRILRLGEM
jgi:ABC-type lipoprotein release transport system permease subunit